MGVWCRCDAHTESEIFGKDQTYLSTGEEISLVLAPVCLICKSVFLMSHAVLPTWPFRNEERQT